MPRKQVYLPTLGEIIMMIKQRPKGTTLEMIAVAAGTSRSWVKMLSMGRIPSPGYPAISAIYTFLNARSKKR